MKKKSKIKKKKKKRKHILASDVENEKSREYLINIPKLSRPVHKRKQIGLHTSLKTVHSATTRNDEALHDPGLPLQLGKGNKFHLTTFTEHVCQK